MKSRRVVVFVWAAVAVAALANLEGAAAQSARGTGQSVEFLSPAQSTRIGDPKLDGGDIEIAYKLDPSLLPYHVTVHIEKAGNLVTTVFSGKQHGKQQPIVQHWNGRDDQGNWCDPGDYTVHVEASAGITRSYQSPLNIVRLGITEIAARPSGAETTEWQMVYFMKKGAYNFYATPELHEYLNIAERDEISDLDLDDGSPRTSVPVHEATDEPVMEQRVGGSWRYDNDRHNYPVCYLKEERPQFDVTFGSTATSSDGIQIGVGYPVAGMEIRCRARDELGRWASSNTDIAPGEVAQFVGKPLPNAVTRTDRNLEWTWQYRAIGDTEWQNVPGTTTTAHRFFTNLAEPQWANGASGTQYSGPWVEVAQYFYEWQVGLDMVPFNKRTVVETLMKGYFGQIGTLPDAIEGVIYDCYPMGGDGGATHYYVWGSAATELTRLLNGHANGIYVNCSDVSSTTSVMLGMLGIEDMQMVRLGAMTLRAIWGVGCPDYTVDLWGNGNHGFSYHHIITRNGGAKVSDSCMLLDEDGDPDHLPGTPGWNHDRTWASYNDLSSKNNTSKSLDPLPKIW